LFTATSAAKPRDGFVDQVADLNVAANVGLDEGGLGTQAVPLGFESLALRFPAAGNYEARTVLGIRQSGRAAYACEGSRDQNGYLIHGGTSDRWMRRTPLITKACVLTSAFYGGHIRLV
jgi:hypothetical protein